MKCPACSHEVSDREDTCSICEFSIDELDARAEFLPPEDPQEDIHDPEGILSARSKSRIQVRIDQFEERSGAEFRLVVLPQIGKLTPPQAAFWLFNRWNLGGEENRGVLLLYAWKERSVQVEVGYGLEPSLSDEEAARVLDFHVIPSLEKGSPDAAFEHGVDLLAELIETAD